MKKINTLLFLLIAVGFGLIIGRRFPEETYWLSVIVNGGAILTGIYKAGAIPRHSHKKQCRE